MKHLIFNLVPKDYSVTNKQENPFRIKKIAVLTSGGDAPGMNAAIRAVVRASVFYGVQAIGIYRGYSGLMEGDFVELSIRSVNKILGQGGTILKSARSEEFRTAAGRQKAFASLQKAGIDALVVIGGDGSFAGALKLNAETGMRVIGIPGTIDNDLYGSDFTIGFDTATNTVIDAVDKIRDTAHAHNRLFFVEVMGRDTGFIALQAGLASGAIEMLLPEDDFSIEQLVEKLEKSKKTGKTSSIVIVAEGEMQGGAYEVAKRVKEKYQEYETKVAVLGHIQRGGSPSCADRVLASRLGVAAVEGLLNGHCNEMVGVMNDQLVYTPFSICIGEKAKLNLDYLRIARILSI